VSRLATADIETADANGDGKADFYYTGHSMAIGGVLEVIAPGAVVKLVKITETNGIATDVSAARRMATTLKQANASNAWPDLIVTPFGSTACDVNPGIPGDELAPLGLEAVTEAVDRIDQALVVASAGNRGESRRFYPAAFTGVLAVGALDASSADTDGSAWSSPTRTGPVATFSNRGSWVDWWAPGVDMVTNHVKGLSFEPGVTINGYAWVSGTSFAAPYVAGLIAEQMAATGASVDVAKAKIAASGVRCASGVGGGIAVALASVTGTATSPASPGSKSAC
jgi:hypothetical protein